MARYDFKFRIDESVSDLAEELAGLQRTEEPFTRIPGLFPTLAETVVFAAMFGFKYDARKKLEKARSNPIDSAIFTNAQLEGYLYALAVADTGDIEILRDDAFDACINLVEEYAFGGLSKIQSLVAKQEKALFETILEEMHEVAAELISQNKPKVPKVRHRKKNFSNFAPSAK